MNLIKLLLLIRFFGAGVASTIFGLQVDHVASIGFTVASIGFLFALFTYYVTVYILKFYILDERGFIVEINKKHYRKLHWALLIMGLAFTGYELVINFKTADVEFFFNVLTKNMFLLIPEWVFSFLITMYNEVVRRMKK